MERVAVLLLVLVFFACSQERDDVHLATPPVVSSADKSSATSEIAEPESAATEADEMLAKGQSLIERNCHDCYRASREGLSEGIKLVEEALAAGVSNEIEEMEGRKVLTAAYRTMVSDFGEGEPWVSKYHQSAADVARLAPKDPNALLQYGDTLQGEERIEVLRRAVEADPGHVDANYVLGMLLVRAGDVETAAPHLIVVAETARGLDADSYVPAMQLALRGAGRNDLAERIAARSAQTPENER